MSIDTEALRREALGQLGPTAADPRWPGRVLALLDRLAAAEHRATRAETQSAIRGRAVAIYRERVREAVAERDAARGYISELETAIQSRSEVIQSRDARIKAVRDVLAEPDAMIGTRTHVSVTRVRRALDGEA